MLSLSVRVALVALMVVMVVEADPTSHRYQPCYAHTVTVTKVETTTKEVPVYKTLLELKTQTSTITKSNTKTVTVVGHHSYKYGR